MSRSLFGASPKVITGNPVVVVPATPAPSAQPVKQNWQPPATNNNSGTAHATPAQVNPQPERLGPSPLAAGVPPLAGGIAPMPTIDRLGLSPKNTLGKSPVPFADNNMAAVPDCLKNDALAVAELTGNPVAKAIVDEKGLGPVLGTSNKNLPGVIKEDPNYVPQFPRK